MIGVILAAGMAKRLRPLTDACPKCLLKVGERTLLARTVDAMIAAGINELVVVTGYRGEMLRGFLTEHYPQLNIHFIHNADYEHNNNIFSLWMTRPFTDGKDFLLMDSDILCDPEAVRRMVNEQGTALALNRHECGEEEIKIITDETGRVVELSKTCSIADAIGESVGIERIADIRVDIIRFVPAPEPEKIDGYKVIFWNWGVAKEDQFSVKYFKNYVAPTAEDGAIVVESLEPSKNYNDQYWMANDQGQQIDAILTNNWDTQFLINLPEPLAKGTKGKLVMKVKADKATNAETQCHKAIPAPGAIEGKDGYGGTYMHYAFAGNINFTTEWNTVSVDFTVPDQADGMQAICLNLEVLKETNKYYFDDVTVYVEKTEEPTWVIDYANPKDAEGNSVTGYPYYRMSEPDGSSFNVENGLLVINNTKEQANNWDLQPFIIDWLTIKEGSGYKVRITMASSVAGKANLSFGTWSGANNQEFEFTASEDFKQYDIEFPSSTVSGENNVHILFQMGKVVGTVKIKKVEVFEL